MPKGHVRDVKAVPRAARPAAAPPELRPDDVEEQDWFLRLPRGAQQEFRDKEKDAVRRDERRAGFSRDSLKRSMKQGVALFLATEVMCAIPNGWHWAAAVPFGAGVGALWFATGAGRFRAMAIAVPPWLLLRAFFMDGDRDLALAVLAFGVLISLAAVVGFVRERRRADDLEH